MGVLLHQGVRADRGERVTVQVHQQDQKHCAQAVVSLRPREWAALTENERLMARLVVRDVLLALQERGYQVLRRAPPVRR